METKRWLAYVYLFLATGLTVGLMACGGGGGGGGTPGISYTGITTQAQIDEGNAVALAAGAWLGGEPGISIDIFGAVQAGPEARQNSFSLGLMPLILDDVIYSIGIPSFAVQPYTGLVTEDPLTILGSCNEGADFVVGGGAIVSSGAVINETTGAFSFTIKFENYCEVESGESLILNGQVNMSGYIDPSTLNNELPSFLKYTITFNSITLEYFESGDSITIMGESSTQKGTFAADWTVTPLKVAMSYVIKDNNSDPVQAFWFRNAEIELEEGDGYADITSMTGKYYDPLFGFVDMSVGIGNAIHMLDSEYRPSSGWLILTGAGGTKARLVFLNSTEYRVDADTTGDGAYDYTEGPLLW